MAVFGDPDYEEEALKLLDKKDLSEIVQNIVDAHFDNEVSFLKWLYEQGLLPINE